MKKSQIGTILYFLGVALLRSTAGAANNSRDLGAICCDWKLAGAGEKFKHLDHIIPSVDSKCSDGCVYEKISAPGSRYCFDKAAGTEACLDEYKGFEVIDPTENPLTYWTLAVGAIRQGPGEVKIGTEQSTTMIDSLKSRIQSYNRVENRISASATVSGSTSTVFADFGFEASVGAEMNFDHWTDDTQESTSETQRAMQTNVEVTVTLEEDDLLLTAFEMKLYVYEIDGHKHHMTLATGRVMNGVFAKPALENLYLDDSFSGIAKLYNLYNVRSLRDMADMITPRQISPDFPIQSAYYRIRNIDFPGYRLVATGGDANVACMTDDANYVNNNHGDVNNEGADLWKIEPSPEDDGTYTFWNKKYRYSWLASSGPEINTDKKFAITSNGGLFWGGRKMQINKATTSRTRGDTYEIVQFTHTLVMWARAESQCGFMDTTVAQGLSGGAGRYWQFQLV